MDFKLSLAIGVMCGMFGAEFARADSQGPILVIPAKPGARRNDDADEFIP